MNTNIKIPTRVTRWLDRAAALGLTVTEDDTETQTQRMFTIAVGAERLWVHVGSRSVAVYEYRIGQAGPSRKIKQNQVSGAILGLSYGWSS